MAKYIDADALIQHIKDVPTWREMLGIGWRSTRYPDGMYDCNDIINSVENAPTAEVVEVRQITEKIIRKKSEIIEYWKNNVKQYRAMQGYCDIEHDTDNFLRGYNEAVEDVLAMLDGKVTE